MAEEKKSYMWVLNYVIAGIFILMFCYVYFNQPPIYAENDCMNSGCKEGYKCLSGASDYICVGDDYYAKYWTIFNMYNYDSCKLIVEGPHADNESVITFFGMTLKECDLLQWSCENPERYNTNCRWLADQSVCRCITQPYTGNQTI